MELYEKNGNAIYILNVLKKYSDEEHILQIRDIKEKVKEIYEIDIDPRTIRRIINLLKYKLDYDISTRSENSLGYFIYRNPDTDFEPGELRAIIDNFSYSNYIVPSISKEIITKCKNMQNIYENEKLKDYKIISKNTKTDNMEVIKNIEDISTAISNKKKIKFDYWKYRLTNKLEKEIVKKSVLTPLAIIYKLQQFYLVGYVDRAPVLFYYRIDRIKNIVELDDKASTKITKKELEDFVNSSFDMHGGEIEQIEITCHINLLDNIIEEFGKDIEIKKINPDYFSAKIESSARGFKYWALRNLEFVFVNKPNSLKKEIDTIIKNHLK